MGQKNSKGNVSVSNADGRIRLRWRYQKKRYSLSLFQFNITNLQQARKIALEIERDILTHDFDTSLTRYKPASVQDIVFDEKKTLVEHFEEWFKNYRNMDCDKNVYHNSTRNMTSEWENFDEKTVVWHFGRETFGKKKLSVSFIIW